MNQAEEKKKYLSRYKKHERRMNRLQAEIEEIRMLKMYPSSGSSGMPRGTDLRDLSDYAADLQDLEEELYQEYVRRIKDYKEINYVIQNLPDQDEKDALFYIYIKGFSVWQTGDKMGYSERQIRRIRDKALEKIMIKE